MASPRAVLVSIAALLVLLLFTIPKGWSSPSPGSRLSCTGNDNIRAVAERLGSKVSNRDFQKDFDLLERDPPVSACYLIRELRVVVETEITALDQEKHAAAMRVIWSIRALRYLTGGLDFKGRTKYEFKETESERTYFLTRAGEEELPFFAVWMSRDTVYIAPPDAQGEIIEKWNRWYSERGETFRYNPSKSIDEWYF